MSRGWRPILLAPLLLGAACGRAYDRVAVIGVVVPLAADAMPPAGEQRRPLPPLGDCGIPPDTREGSILATVDRRAFWLEHGRDFPAWSPPAPAPAQRPDPALARLRELRAASVALQQALVASPATGGDGRPLLAPREWSSLAAGILALGERIDAFLAADRDRRGTQAGGDDARLAEAMWRGMDEASAALAAALDGLLGGELAAPGDPAMAARLAACATAGRALAATIAGRDAPALLARVRGLRAELIDLERVPAVAADLVDRDDGPADQALARRDRILGAFAEAHRRLAAVAAQWLADQAALIDPQPRPTLVWQPAARMD